jgi:hypothetical protein
MKRENAPCFYESRAASETRIERSVKYGMKRSRASPIIIGLEFGVGFGIGFHQSGSFQSIKRKRRLQGATNTWSLRVSSCGERPFRPGQKIIDGGALEAIPSANTRASKFAALGKSPDCRHGDAGQLCHMGCR